jgi:hypothetical protein
VILLASILYSAFLCRLARLAGLASQNLLKPSPKARRDVDS